MNYIILKTGFGKGISLFKSTELKTYHKDELPKVLLTVGQELLDEGGYDTLEEAQKKLCTYCKGTVVEYIDFDPIEDYGDEWFEEHN